MQREQLENISDYVGTEPEGEGISSDPGDGKLSCIVEPKSMESLNDMVLFEEIMSDERHDDNASSATEAIIKCDGTESDISTGIARCSKLTADSKDSMGEIVDKPNKPKIFEETPAFQIQGTSSDSINKMESVLATMGYDDPFKTNDQDLLDKKNLVSSDAISLALDGTGTDDEESYSTTCSIPTSDFSSDSNLSSNEDSPKDSDDIGTDCDVSVHVQIDFTSPTESKLLNDKIDFPAAPTKEMCWYKGHIRVSVNHQRKFAFIKSFELDENIHLHLEKLPEFGLPLRREDEVTFQSNIKASKPSAHRAKVLRYKNPRSSNEMDEFFDYSMEILQSSRAPILIKELSSLDAFWHYFDLLIDCHLSKISWKAMKFVTLFFKSNPSNADVNRILDILGQKSHYLEQMADFSTEIVSSNFLIVSNFCEQVINKNPRFVVRLFPLIKKVLRKCFEQILLKFITKDGPTKKKQDNWESLVEGISDEEMLRDDLIKRDNNLSKVKVDAPYDSYFQYMDTYFRLLKAETFFGIQEAISSLKQGTLGNQNINIFDGIRFTGVMLEEASVLLSIPTSTEEKQIQYLNNDTLMHGNLICLLIDNQWKKFIWMTVERKDDVSVGGKGSGTNVPIQYDETGRDSFYSL